MGTKINVGRRVKYSPDFLRSIGCYNDKDMRDARGVVQQVQPFGQGLPSLAVIEWNNSRVPPKVLSTNLVTA
jgi:hypothetical protein